MVRDKYITIPELAKLLGITRIAVYKRVKKGRIKAVKIGRAFAISKKHVGNILKGSLTEDCKRKIEDAVKKTVAEYGEVLKLLGRE